MVKYNKDSGSKQEILRTVFEFGSSIESQLKPINHKLTELSDKINAGIKAPAVETDERDVILETLRLHDLSGLLEDKRRRENMKTNLRIRRKPQGLLSLTITPTVHLGSNEERATHLPSRLQEPNVLYQWSPLSCSSPFGRCQEIPHSDLDPP